MIGVLQLWMSALKKPETQVVLCFSSSLFFSALSHAGNVTGEQHESQEVSRSSMVFNTPETDNVSYAKQWNLSVAEYQRYLSLKVVDSAFSAPNVTPYEVLGKYADTKNEQTRYARLFRNMMFDNQVRSVEWWAAVQEQTNELSIENYLAMTPKSSARIEELMSRPQVSYANTTGGSTAAPLAQSSIQRLSLFVTLDCDESCTSMFEKSRLTQQSRGYAGIDIVFVGMEKPDRDAVTRWAIEQDVSVEAVQQRTITLNYDNPKYKKIRSERKVPLLVDGSGREVKI